MSNKSYREIVNDVADNYGLEVHIGAFMKEKTSCFVDYIDKFVYLDKPVETLYDLVSMFHEIGHYALNHRPRKSMQEMSHEELRNFMDIMIREEKEAWAFAFSVCDTMEILLPVIVIENCKLCLYGYIYYREAFLKGLHPNKRLEYMFDEQWKIGLLRIRRK